MSSARFWMRVSNEEPCSGSLKNVNKENTERLERSVLAAVRAVVIVICVVENPCLKLLHANIVCRFG